MSDGRCWVSTVAAAAAAVAATGAVTMAPSGRREARYLVITLYASTHHALALRLSTPHANLRPLVIRARIRGFILHADNYLKS